ncbi:unnamed protein product [Mortierella alpina]
MQKLSQHHPCRPEGAEARIRHVLVLCRLFKAGFLARQGPAVHGRGSVLPKQQHAPTRHEPFQRSLNERPTAAAHYNMGVCYFQLGDFQSSINSFQESLKLSPHHADVHTNIATAHIKLNSNLTQALSHLQAAANIAPQDAEIQFNLAVISEQTGDFDGAINAYKAAVDLGLETANVNLRNVKTKKFAKMAKQAEFQDTKNE